LQNMNKWWFQLFQVFQLIFLVHLATSHELDPTWLPGADGVASFLSRRD
jgi:hypothetical protein